MSDAKRIVLARRARFVAAAVASAGIMAGCETCKPQPCLSVAYVPPEGGPVPQPCLSVIATPDDAAADADTDAGGADGGDAGDAGTRAKQDAGKAGPTPTTRTLRDAGRAPPRVCLSPASGD